MINIFELHDLVACRYLNCYRTYIDLLTNNDALKLRGTLLHRMHIYYAILELIYDSVNE